MAEGGGIRGAIEAQLEVMSPRDRALLSGLMTVFSLLFVFALWWLARGAVNDKASRVRDAKDNLEVISAMADKYDTAQMKIKRAEERLQQFKGQPTSAYLESVARTNGVIESLTVNQQGTTDDGDMKKTAYRAELKRVTLEQAVDFLHDVETSGYPTAVTLARFKPNGVPGQRVVDVTIELASYEVGQ